MGGKPFLAAAIAALEVSGALVHPDHYRTLLMRPLLPVSPNLSTGGYASGEVGRSATIAHDLLVSNGHGWVVVRPLALDGLRARSGSKAFVTT